VGGDAPRGQGHSMRLAVVAPVTHHPLGLSASGAPT
jgi:hypothetical protein